MTNQKKRQLPQQLSSMRRQQSLPLVSMEAYSLFGLPSALYPSSLDLGFHRELASELEMS